MHITVKTLTHKDISLSAEIASLLGRSCIPQLSSYLIYQDRGYLQYFSKLLKGAADAVFYAEIPDTGKIAGAAHFKLSGDSIRLNCISIDEQFRSDDIGFTLLAEALKVLTENNQIQRFELDVFETNKEKFNLYLRFGMEVSEYCYWYDITSYCADETIGVLGVFPLDQPLRIITDHHGFKQLYLGEQLLGALINGTHLIMRREIDYALLQKLNQAFRQSWLQSVCLISKRERELLLLDRSFHLTVSAKKLQSAIRFNKV